MPPPIRWKWGLRGGDFDKSTVETSLSQLRHGDASLAADPKLLKVRRQQGINNKGSNDGCQYNNSYNRRNDSWCKHSRSCNNAGSNYNS